MLQPLGKELEDLVVRMRRNMNDLFLRRSDMEHIDVVYQIDLPYSFEFEFDFTDPTNPRPKPPLTWGVVGSARYPISAIENNDLEGFWFEPLPDRIGLSGEEIDLGAYPGVSGLLTTGDVLVSTPIGTGTLSATYTEPFIPGRLYVTLAGATGFGFVNKLIDRPGYIEIHGITVKETQETERLAFDFNSTQLTSKYWREITDIKIINIEPATATLTIHSAGGTKQLMPDTAYLQYDNVGGRESYWEIDDHDGYAALQHILPVAETATEPPNLGLDLDVHRMWLLRDELGNLIPFADVVDYTIERFRPYIYVLLSNGEVFIYSKLTEYWDLASMRLLKLRSDSPKAVLDVSFDDAVFGDEIRVAARMPTPTKNVASYHLQAAKPSFGGSLDYIDTSGGFGATRSDAIVTLEVPTTDIPYKSYTFTLDEYGVYTFVLTINYIDGTSDVDVRFVWSRYKAPLAEYHMGSVVDTPLAICFDYDQRLWLGGEFSGDFKFKELLRQADLMLIDYDKKLLYLREQYDLIIVGAGTTTTTTSSTSTSTTTSTTSSTASSTSTSTSSSTTTTTTP